MFECETLTAALAKFETLGMRQIVTVMCLNNTLVTLSPFVPFYTILDLGVFICVYEKCVPSASFSYGKHIQIL